MLSICMDFKKTFDSVIHLNLLRKIRSFGIVGTFINGLRPTYPTAINMCVLTTIVLTFSLFYQVFRRAASWDHYSSFYTLMIFQIVSCFLSFILMLMI